MQASRGLTGWTECRPGSCANVCTWGGVDCGADVQGDNSGSSVTVLDLSCKRCSVPLQGRLSDSLAQMQHLAQLDLSNNSLSGPLPEAWGQPDSFPELLDLNLNGNALTVRG